MHALKKLAIATATVGVIALSPMAAYAEDGDMSRQLTEARQEGSVWTAFALNRHLSPFSIDVEIENGVAVLTGEVESEVDRDLAEQVALGVEGIREVDNQLKVEGETADRSTADDSGAAFSTRFNDATTTATVKSKLLWNRNTEGLDINVGTRNGVVTLQGNTDSAESKELAERLARNTEGVRQVDNQLEVNAEAGTADKARDKADQAGAAISDAWISSKVKSSFLFNNSLDGLDISVDTKGGQVTLGGQVATSAEKDLAIEIAEDIRGVQGVNADSLQVGNEG
ncbi:BON domain-containing protein [Halopseudomonas bauzanensis]|uniref:Osmotically-inducible protein OsmY, contains BON domain n=1 Tax=Halopseudomonas bauzanensis TaxID=653930 RepID=A0A1I4LNL1_9GAMM|nr:BON domain-containing protein [Halopseudomonas bauzanensis]SER88486.1 Osmotically-inducible protein OsmY, contains BON domain [Halopseudomonas bauzanensis]SFL92426.1 Osmotically-inducible protein OsmY, contains BON domain [Halopseudomonas bauzanensis]